jgi:hypothetical protein
MEIQNLKKLCGKLGPGRSLIQSDTKLCPRFLACRYTFQSPSNSSSEIVTIVQSRYALPPWATRTSGAKDDR